MFKMATLAILFVQPEIYTLALCLLILIVGYLWSNVFRKNVSFLLLPFYNEICGLLVDKSVSL